MALQQPQHAAAAAAAVRQPSRSENINSSLMKLKLLEALRNNDTSKLADLIKQIDNSNNYDLTRLKDELLLFAVQVGSLSIIKHIVQREYVDDINTQDDDGNTALHLAATSNRNDVIQYLLGLPNVNDCLYNKDSRQPIQCTTNIETAQLMDFLRGKYIEKIAADLRNGFESRNFELLDKLLTNPRDKELLDINGTDPITSDTVLIEFVKKNDYEMVKFILTHGGDPFKRSLSGKLPEECTVDPIMKQIISDSFTNQNIMEVTARPQEGSPTFKGFLKKWTNFAGGYKLRWVVLDSTATLSYYKSPNDMNNTCRGSIHLAHAMLRVDSSENTKFEIIIQNPSDGSPVRWHLMANHATEAQKWIWVLQNAIRFAKDTEKKQRTSMMLTHRAKDHHHHELVQSPHQQSFNDNNNNNNNNSFHSSVPPTIPEREVLSSGAMQADHDSRSPVSIIVSQAHKAADDMKELIDTNNSDSELPLKVNLETQSQKSEHGSDDEVNYSDLENDNDRDSANFSDNYEGTTSSHELNTNTNSINSDSLRNHYGPVPDRSSEYDASNRNSNTLDPSYHNRAPSVASFTSNQSNSSETASKSSRAKRLYKKPLHKLSKIGRKTRDSFLVENNPRRNSTSNHSSTQLSKVESNASYISNSSSAISSPNINGNHGTFENDTSRYDDDYNSTNSQNQYHTSSSSSNYPGQSNDLNVVRNQMAMQLKTFKDFLSSAEADDTISKHDLVDMSVGILNTLNMLINQEGECVNIKYGELVKRLEKQQKISSIWENSIKQLEMEIHDRESKIVELEDKLKALKKSLRTSISQLRANQPGRREAGVIPANMLPKESNAPTNENSAASLARQRLTANLPKKNVDLIPEVAMINLNEPPAIESHQESEESRALEQQRALQEKFNLSSTPPVSSSPSSPVRVPVPAPAPAPPIPPSYAPPPVPIDSTLTEFLEESDDSDDEFFDAAEDDDVQDVSVLARRETLRAQKRRSLMQDQLEKSSYPSQEQPQQQQQQPFEPASSEQYGKISRTVPPVPSVLPPPVPTIERESASASADSDDDVKESFEKKRYSSDNKEVLTAHSSHAPKHEDVSTEELPKSNFQPTIDQHGHYVVNKHELVSETQMERYSKILKDGSFEGYEDPLRLSLDPEDNRPSISLWGVLKSLIGKDMTKMTLPVSFNEPTSLLQRNVEVVEYSDLLDKASAIDSSVLRMVYVATFAASEYASTVGRIAKPFNPLLGETFEYSRPDKGYRCFVEQVSHHPPISALVAESPSWSYYGESNVKTSFGGRSFDIKHLGTWFCELYPDAGVDCKDGSRSDKELYSWKKVNNRVIGIIMGNPSIDNYGEMEIRNHMTGDYMKFEFKPKGWKASSAYEVKGEVFNAKGKLVYYVGGRWNSQIFCKPADDKKAEKFLVWEAAPRDEMMFHLTHFAATLNAPQPHLLPKIACTDTRLRPDQRAMENGDYDLASSEKNRVEEKQREARKQREAKGEIYKPSFFTKSRHPITGDEFWEYKGQYWRERIEGKLKHYKDIF